MKSSQLNSLKRNNTFAIDATCSEILTPNSIDDLMSMPEIKDSQFYILGEGSNTLFTEQLAPTIISPQFKGIEVNETPTDFIVTVGASENWHYLVTFCIEHNMFGLENLALIPGSVGAAPIQNIGAYGSEFSDFCLEIHWFDFKAREQKKIDNSSCQFGYRESIFKNKLYNKGLVTHVVLKLEKQWQANLTYSGLDRLPKDVSAREVMEKVILLRQSKLPDPKILPNAGSFFKNPIVEKSQLSHLKTTYPNIPYYPHAGEQIKLAAGWLIEQCGLKGYRTNNVGVHNKQALVLINFKNGTGKNVVELAFYIQKCVFDKFAILLEPEVKMVTSKGEIKFEELKQQ